MPESSGLQQIEEGNPAAGKHHQIGFHQTPVHFHTIGIFAGFFLVDGPDNIAAFGMKFVSFNNDFMITVLFICQAPEVKVAQMIDHHVKAGRSLITKQHGSGCRLVGKQLAVPQKFSPSDDSRIAEAGENVVMQPGRLRQVFDQTADHRTLLECKGRIHMLRRIKRRAPAGSGIMGGDKRQPVDGAQRGQLPAQRRLVEKIALPGAFAAGAQAIFVHPAIKPSSFSILTAPWRRTSSRVL